VPAVLELERLTAAPAAEARDTQCGDVAPDGMPRHGIRLDGVTFRYPGTEVDVLNDLDLFIPSGRSLAIVGENGAGKTTLVKLLARLYDPTSGRISVDGVPLQTIAARAWQRRVSAIFQDFTHFALTARDNVVFGAPERMDDAAALVEAARKAGVLEVVDGLPNSWDTMLSRQYRGGADLSGGQWQRLALARALFAVAGGARVLILDEPTANLDVRAEAALYERFLDITQGLTTIVISHRFSTVRRADRIVVLEGGRVVEDGTHDELLAAGGRYADMFRLQAKRFADYEEEAADVR
jgi:ATP-binding cassette subfamily B protein